MSVASAGFVAGGTGTPNPAARALSAILLVVSNVLPIVAVLRGDLGVGEVFLIYWLENVVIWITTTVKIVTARKPMAPGSFTVNGRPVNDSGAAGALMALFFCFHFGIFTLVHGVFSMVLVFMTGGFKSSAGTWLLLAGGIAVSHLVSLAVNWFGQREREAFTAKQVMGLPYPRMIVLHLAVIGGFFLIIGPDGSPDRQLGAVALLCGLKLVLDLGFHLRERWRARETLVTLRAGAE